MFFISRAYCECESLTVRVAGNLVEQDNICGDEDIAFMNHEERYEFCLKKELLISRRLKELNLSQDDANLYELYALE